MPYFCSALGCKNNSSRKECQDQNITFHPFPLKNDFLLKFWLIQMRRTDFTPDVTSWLCSEHFEEDCFYYHAMTGRRIIQKDAVPTRFVFVNEETNQPGISTAPTVLHIKQVKRRKTTSYDFDSFSGSPSKLLYSSSKFKDATVQTVISGITTQLIPSASSSGRTSSPLFNFKEAGVQTQMDGISALLIENTILQNDLNDLKNKVNRLTFSVEAITDDGLMKTLTGFSIELLKAIFSLLFSDKRWNVCCNLSPFNQFFLFLMYLRTGISQLFISILFKTSHSSVSRLTNNISSFIYDKVKSINIWPSRELINKRTSPVFFKNYPNCRVILECIELQIQRPSCQKTQRLTFSSRKNTFTVKGLVGKTPSGGISYISDLWPGSISDRELFLKSGILDHLEENDLVIASKHFDIKQELESKGCSLTTPKFLTDRIMLTVDEQINYPEATHHRIHYDLATSRFNKFKFFDGQISTMAFDVANEYFYIIAFLINFGSPLIHIKQH